MNTVKTVDETGAVTFLLGLRDVDEEARRQLKQTRQMEVQREIIQGLGSEYYFVLLVNPNTDAVTVYRPGHSRYGPRLLQAGSDYRNDRQCFAEDVHAAKTVGMNEHIAKPLDLKVLARILNHWLR